MDAIHTATQITPIAIVNVLPNSSSLIAKGVLCAFSSDAASVTPF
jgi:hypothetical protein